MSAKTAHDAPRSVAAHRGECRSGSTARLADRSRPDRVIPAPGAPMGVSAVALRRMPLAVCRCTRIGAAVFLGSSALQQFAAAVDSGWNPEELGKHRDLVMDRSAGA